VIAPTPITIHTHKKNNNMVPKMVHQPKFKRTHLQTTKHKNPNLEHKKYETTQDVQNENYENT
jgi:hypothetical protein